MDRTGADEIKQAFGTRMRKLRKARGMSQEALAFASGLDRSYLGAIERGEKNLSLINITRIADALGVGAGELFAASSR
jgi:transcriptional regulator with XRE-family HTH domain